MPVCLTIIAYVLLKKNVIVLTPNITIIERERTEEYSFGILKLKRSKYARHTEMTHIIISKLKIIQEGRLDLEYRIIL